MIRAMTENLSFCFRQARKPMIIPTSGPPRAMMSVNVDRKREPEGALVNCIRTRKPTLNNVMVSPVIFAGAIG